MALTVEEVLQRLLEEDSDEDEEEVGDFADEDGTTVTLDPTVLSAALPDSETPAEKDSLLLSDRELLEQLDTDTFNAEDSVDEGTGVRVAATSGGHYLEQLAIDTFNAEDSTEDNDEGSSVDTSSDEDNEGTSVGAASGRRPEQQTTENNPGRRSYTTERGRGRRGTRGRGRGRRGSQARAREESSRGRRGTVSRRGSQGRAGVRGLGKSSHVGRQQIGRKRQCKGRQGGQKKKQKGLMWKEFTVTEESPSIQFTGIPGVSAEAQSCSMPLDFFKLFLRWLLLQKLLSKPTVMHNDILLAIQLLLHGARSLLMTY